MADASNETARSQFFNSMGQSLSKRNIFTIHDYHNRRYYASVDATILLNGKVVEEIVQIQWTIQEQVLPLFGYNSYVWDDIAKGNRIIQGAFAINFTVPDYLNLLIEDKATDESMTFTNTGREIQQDKHSPAYGKAFTIGIGYGKQEDKLTGKNPCIMLENCVVQSCGQALDTQGQGIVEMYQFVARDRSMSR